MYLFLIPSFAFEKKRITPFFLGLKAWEHGLYIFHMASCSHCVTENGPVLDIATITRPFVELENDKAIAVACQHVKAAAGWLLKTKEEQAGGRARGRFFFRPMRRCFSGRRFDDEVCEYEVSPRAV